jgi:hypothetical protein
MAKLTRLIYITAQRRLGTIVTRPSRSPREERAFEDPDLEGASPQLTENTSFCIFFRHCLIHTCSLYLANINALLQLWTSLLLYLRPEDIKIGSSWKLSCSQAKRCWITERLCLADRIDRGQLVRPCRYSYDILLGNGFLQLLLPMYPDPSLLHPPTSESPNVLRGAIALSRNFAELSRILQTEWRNSSGSGSSVASLSTASSPAYSLGHQHRLFMNFKIHFASYRLHNGFHVLDIIIPQGNQWPWEVERKPCFL